MQLGLSSLFAMVSAAEPPLGSVGSPRTSRDSQLFDNFIGGDNSSFQELYERYNNKLLIHCYKLVGSYSIAEDLVQELWERVIALRATERSLENPGGFFFTIARNLALDHLRKHKNNVTLEEVSDAHFSTVEGSENELEEIALEALDKLSFDHKEVLVLNLYNGYSFEEIADLLGKSSAAIWARASRARVQLRKLVAEEARKRGLELGSYEKIAAVLPKK